jgi:hypothetical protein
MDSKFEIKLENQNGREYGYGIYVNVHRDGMIWASRMVSKNADEATIKKACRNALASARRAYEKENGL